MVDQLITEWKVYAYMVVPDRPTEAEVYELLSRLSCSSEVEMLRFPEQTYYRTARLNWVWLDRQVALWSPYLTAQPKVVWTRS